MAARQTLRSASSSLKTLLSYSSSTTSHFASKASKFAKPSTASSRFSLRKSNSSRLPVELAGGLQSLIPLHSATASALFTSLLSLHNASWGCLSEGFATPL